MASRRWGAAGSPRARALLDKSAMVSDAAQNVGGELTHPIVVDRGIAMSWGSPGYAGRMTASLGASLALRCSR